MNKQFKEGDQVVRVGKPCTLFGHRAEVGQLATVVWSPYMVDGDVTVKFVDGARTHTQSWARTYTELVQVQESPCKFVPGSTYRDRTGNEYRFVVYAEEAAPPYRAVFLTSTGNITCRHSDGILNLSGRTSDFDILPNKKTRTINVYRDERGGLDAIDSGSQSDKAFREDAADGSGSFIGEVVEEYETH